MVWNVYFTAAFNSQLIRRKRLTFTDTISIKHWRQTRWKKEEKRGSKRLKIKCRIVYSAKARREAGKKKIEKESIGSLVASHHRPRDFYVYFFPMFDPFFHCSFNLNPKAKGHSKRREKCGLWITSAWHCFAPTATYLEVHAWNWHDALFEQELTITALLRHFTM